MNDPQMAQMGQIKEAHSERQTLESAESADDCREV
jgi:hypothetical protein